MCVCHIQLNVVNKIYMLLNDGKSHWVVFVYNTLKAFVEIWQSLRGATTCNVLIRKVLNHLANCGVHIPGGGVNAVPIHHRRHMDWEQNDCHSCGIYAALVLRSLMEGRRVAIKQSDVRLWRFTFGSQIVQRVDEFKRVASSPSGSSSGSVSAVPSTASPVPSLPEDVS